MNQPLLCASEIKTLISSPVATGEEIAPTKENVQTAKSIQISSANSTMNFSFTNFPFYFKSSFV